MDPCVLIYTYTPIHTRAHRIFPSPLISWAMLPWRCLSLFHNNEWHTWNSFRQDHSYPHLHCQAMSYPHVHMHTHTQEHTRTEPRHFAGLTDFLWAIVSASRWWYPGPILEIHCAQTFLPHFLSFSTLSPSFLSCYYPFPSSSTTDMYFSSVLFFGSKCQSLLLFFALLSVSSFFLLFCPEVPCVTPEDVSPKTVFTLWKQRPDTNTWLLNWKPAIMACFWSLPFSLPFWFFHTCN